MAYIADFKLTATTDKECGYIYVDDVSIYPLLLNDRDQYGIALFWSTDQLVTILGYDESNSEDWFFDAENNYVFQIKAYLVDIWDSTATYDATTRYKIVWHSGYFYMQTEITPAGTPGSHGTTGWSRIYTGDTDPVSGGTIDGTKLYALFEKSLVTETQLRGWSVCFVETDCPSYSIEKTACHNWELHNNSGGTITVGKIRLRTYDHILLDDELTFTSNIASINLESYDGGDDGVYIVEIWGQESGETEDTLKASVLIYEFCTAEECYKRLFKFIICKCNDPCDDTDCEEQYNIAERRYDMNMIWGLYHMIERYVYVDKFQYMGMLSIDEGREEFISQVGRMVDKLKIITERCGNCTDDATNDIIC